MTKGPRLGIGSAAGQAQGSGFSQGPLDPGMCLALGRAPKGLVRRPAAAPASEKKGTGAGGSQGGREDPARVSGLCTGCGEGTARAWETRERRYCCTVAGLINMLLTLSWFLGLIAAAHKGTGLSGLRGDCRAAFDLPPLQRGCATGSPAPGRPQRSRPCAPPRPAGRRRSLEAAARAGPRAP